MKCTGTTCNQGRTACKSGCAKTNRTCSAECARPATSAMPQGEPWDWIDDLWLATRWTIAGVSIAAIAILIAMRLGSPA